MNNEQKGFVTSKRTVIYSTFIKATLDAANEILLREGNSISADDIVQIAISEGAKYRLSVRLLYAPSEKDLDDIIKIYQDQWSDSYFYLQDKMSH